VRKIPYRVSLPIVFGLIALALIASAIYEGRHCMGYDGGGRPFWPCDAPRYFLAVINLPPIALIQIPLNHSATVPLYLDYVVEFPLILLLWWFIGTRIDFGLLGIGKYENRRSWTAIMITATTILVGLIVWSIWSDIAFHLRYPIQAGSRYSNLLVELRSVPVVLWFSALAYAFVSAAFRISHGQKGELDHATTSRRVKRIAALIFCAYSACAISVFLHLSSMEKRELAEQELRSIIVKGKVVDEKETPVASIRVDLIPLSKISDDQWQPTIYSWTNEKGEYTLNPEDPGAYILAVLWNSAPDSRHPFLTRFYPDEPDQQHAQVLQLTTATHINLAPISVHRLPVVKVPVAIFWSDGTPEPSAHLLFTNTLFTHEATVGGVSFHPDDDGTVTLPANFEYQGGSQIDCDGGQTIVHKYTPPVNFTTRPDTLPRQPLRFVLPGTPCVVWHPK